MLKVRSLYESPYNTDPTLWGSALRALVFQPSSTSGFTFVRRFCDVLSEY